jgi:putative transposase
VDIPRICKDEFKLRTVPSYKSSTEDLESMVIQIYHKGLTTSEIADLTEKTYEAFYTKATISNMTQAVYQQVEQFHTSKLKYHYALNLADVIFISVRLDNVAKESLHILVGITPEGIEKSLTTGFTPMNPKKTTGKCWKISESVIVRKFYCLDVMD